MKGAAPKKAPRETSPSALRPAILRIIDRRIIARGEIDLPCIPALAETYVTRLVGMWALLGKAFAQNEVTSLKEAVDRALQTGFQASPFARMVVSYQALSPPHAGVEYAIRLKEPTMAEHYAHWAAERKPPLFGSFPDAKVLEMAEQLGDPAAVRVLDLGAGTGRNALALARRGYPTDALEVVREFADQMRSAARAESLPLEIIEGDVLDEGVTLTNGLYRLVVLSEVTSHFRDASEVRTTFSKLADAVASGGLVVANAFLPVDGYKPDAMARQVSQTAWSSIFSRAELDVLVKELPFDKISDESAHDHERDHAPRDAWPPTGWFVDWSQGRNVFDVPAGRGPVELRWLVYRRR